MLVLGRSPNLALGAITAIFNVVVAFHVLGFNPDVGQITTVNLAFGALIAFVANQDSITTAAGEAAKARINNNPNNGTVVTTITTHTDPPVPPVVIVTPPKEP